METSYSLSPEPGERDSTMSQLSLEECSMSIGAALSYLAGVKAPYSSVRFLVEKESNGDTQTTVELKLLPGVFEIVLEIDTS